METKERKGEGFFNHWLKEKPGRIYRSTMTEESTPTHRPSALMMLLWTSIFLRFPQLPNRSDPSIFPLFSRLFFPSKPWISTFFFLFSQLSSTKKRKNRIFWLFCLGFVEIVDHVGVWFIWKKWDRKKRGEEGCSILSFFSTIGMFGGENLRWGSLVWFRNLGLSLYSSGFWLGIVVILNNLANVMWVYLEFFLV